MHILMYGFLKELPKHDGRIADVIGKLGLPLVGGIEDTMIAVRLNKWKEVTQHINECKALCASDEHERLMEEYLKRKIEKELGRKLKVTPTLPFVSSLLVVYRPDLPKKTIETYIQRYRLQIESKKSRTNSPAPSWHFPALLEITVSHNTIHFCDVTQAELRDVESTDQPSRVVVIRQIKPVASSFPLPVLFTKRKIGTVPITQELTTYGLLGKYARLRIKTE